MGICRISKPKTLRKLSAIIGRDVVYATTRGGSCHIVHVQDVDGLGWSIWPDGHVQPNDFYNAHISKMRVTEVSR